MILKINEKYFPIIILQLKSDKNILKEQELNIFLFNFSKLLNKNKPFNVLVDCSELNIFPLQYCLKIAIFLNKYKKKIKELIKKSVIFISTTKIKELLKIIFKLAPPKSDMIITKNYNIALKNINI